MNRFDRVASILILLQSRRVTTAGELAQRFGVSLRTIYRDLGTLEQAGIPLCAEPGKGYSLVEGYHLPPVMFTPDEAATLLLAEKMVTRLSDVSSVAGFASVFDKIRAVLPAPTRDMVAHLDATVEVYPRPTNGLETPPCHLTPIRQALARHETLMLSYDAFYNHQPPQQREVEPIGLCYYSMHWHLIAWCRLRNDYRDFRLDRIVSLNNTNRPASLQRQMSLKDYFLSLTQKGELRPVRLTVTSRTAIAMESAAQYYGFIESVPEGDQVSMLFVTADEGWMARWLMMFLDGITHIDSQTVKDEMERLMACRCF